MKSRVLFFSFITLILGYVLTLFSKINGFVVYEVWFSVALFFVGVYSLIYAYMYKLDSEFYFGILNILFAFATAYKFIFNLKFAFFYFVYLFCFAISHFAVFVIFRQIIHFKLFAILAIEGILIMAYKINFLSLSHLVIINGLYFVFVLINFAFRLTKNLRRE